MAVLAGALDSVSMHVHAEADLDAADNKGRSPLILAVSRGHLDICRLLLDAGADPTTKDYEGNDALAVARARGDDAVVRMLQRACSSTAEYQETDNEIDRDRRVSEPLNGRSLDRMAGTSETIEEIAARTTTDVQTECDSERRESEEDTVSGPPVDDHVEFDLSGWQEEIATEVPPDDVSCADDAAKLQGAVSRHSPVDTDETWDDVEIDLPELEYFGSRRSRFTTETRTAVRMLFLEALRNGSVDHDRIRRALAADDELEATKRKEIEANLCLVLGDAGVVIGEEPITTDIAAEITDEDEDRFGDVATEAIDLLARLQSSDVDPLAPYLRSLPADRLTRNDETALGMTIEEGMRDVLAAITESPVAVSRLLTDVRSVMEGSIPAQALFGTLSNPEDSDAATTEDMAVQQEDEEEPGTAPIPDSRSAHLRAIVEHCQRREIDRAALEALLFEAGLSAEYREELQCIAEQDSECEHAATRIQAGLAKVQRAKRRFVEANLKLVIWVAKKHRGLSLGDRIQAGNIGAMHAVDRFDYRRGGKFSTYAVWWIRQRITRTVADTARTIRLPVHVTESMRRVERARVLAYATDGRDSDIHRIAALADLPPDQVRKMFAVPEDPLPMDDPGVVEEVRVVADEETPTPEGMALVAQMQDLVREQVDRLTPREATVLRRRFGIECDDHTLEEVGREFGVTRERIRQIEAKALRKLRDSALIERFREFLR